MSKIDIIIPITHTKFIINILRLIVSTNISLTPELEQYAKSQVASGLYGSVSEFMRDAVRLHREKNLEHRLYLHAMHKELTSASQEIDRGDISLLNIQALTELAFDELDSDGV